MLKVLVKVAVFLVMAPIRVTTWYLFTREEAKALYLEEKIKQQNKHIDAYN